MNRSILTNVPATSSLPLVSDPAVRRQDGVPVKRICGTTRPVDLEFLGGTVPDRVDAPQKTFEPPLIPKTLPTYASANSTPLQIWEGTVVDVDHAAGTMQVLLDAKIGQMPQHTGEIELKWVDEQDQDLVRPGAVFYLMLFQRIKPSIENAQELRFRRRPAWSAFQVEQVERDAAMLRSKMKARPVAE
jgi:hypothetical protein